MCFVPISGAWTAVFPLNNPHPCNVHVRTPSLNSYVKNLTSETEKPLKDREQ